MKVLSRYDLGQLNIRLPKKEYINPILGVIKLSTLMKDVNKV